MECDYLRKNIYYLNLGEIKEICKKYEVPYKIYYEDDEEKIHNSQIMLRKGKIIKNILKTLDGKKVRKYIIPNINVNFEKVDQIYKMDNNIYFGQYKWADAKKKIFPNNFKPVLCQLMLFDLWAKKRTFTYKDFIKYYMKYHKKYDSLDHPEWKYIEDTKQGYSGSDWKQTRKQIAKIVMKKIREKLKN